MTEWATSLAMLLGAGIAMAIPATGGSTQGPP
jgi:hypothetical protein